MSYKEVVQVNISNSPTIIRSKNFLSDSQLLSATISHIRELSPTKGYIGEQEVWALVVGKGVKTVWITGVIVGRDQVMTLEETRT